MECMSLLTKMINYFWLCVQHWNDCDQSTTPYHYALVILIIICGIKKTRTNNLKVTEGTYLWESNGAPLTYTSWHPWYGAGAGNTASRDCIATSTSSGAFGTRYWVTEDCSSLRYALCQKGEWPATIPIKDK